MNELEHIITAAGDAGPLIVFLVATMGLAWIIKSGFVVFVQAWRDAARERNAIDEKRNEIDDKMASTQLKVAATLERIMASLDQTQTLISAKAQESSMGHGATQAHVERVELAVAQAAETLTVESGKGEHQRKKIAESVVDNGVKLDEISKLLKAAVARIDEHHADKEVITLLSAVDQKLDKFVKTHRGEIPLVASGETTIDEKADKEA